ncbi:MAG: hypothetical protein QXF76_04045 [Candidatus Anstonellales archaeon]
MKFVKVEVPEKLKELIERINWKKVNEKDINLLIFFSEQFLENKGLLYEEENKKKNNIIKQSMES